jgi:O-antigen/teichoic acid export membrane protein
VPEKIGGGIRSQLARRFGWGLADQMMSSLSNAALSFYVARELGPSKFGAFSIAYVTYAFALNASRGLATDPLLVRYSNAELPKWRRAAGSSTGIAVVVGALTGVIALAVAAVLRGNLGLAFLGLGLTLPGLLLQDSWRYVFFALGRGGQAFLNDTVWTLALVPAMLTLRVTHQSNVFWFVLAWGACAYLGALVGPFQARVVPKVLDAWEWVHLHRDLSARYLAENTINSGAAQLRLYFVGAIAGLTAVGYVQAAALLMGPFLVVFMGISLVTVPEAARILHRAPHHFVRYCVLVGVGLAGCGLLWGLLLLVALPRGLGVLLLGDKLWRPAAALVVPYTVWVIGGCLIGGATAGLRALGAARRSLRAMIIASVLFLTCSGVGTYLDGATGAVVGAAAATMAAALVWWWQLRLGIQESGIFPAPAAADYLTGTGHSKGRHRRPATAARVP